MALGIAAVGRRNRQVVIVVDMARSAGDIRMAIRQQETRRTVVKLRAQPAVERMAGFAGSGKLRADVVRVGGLLVVIQMTGLASRGKPLELADGRTLVAILALHGGVGAEQGKTILVIADLFCGDLPA